MKIERLMPGQAFRTGKQTKFRIFRKAVILNGENIPVEHKGKLLVIHDNCKQSIMEPGTEVIVLKKAIVLSGPKASGKTWITIGLREFFQVWGYSSFTHDDVKNEDLTKFELVIIDECKDIDEIISFDELREKYPHVNFVFCTQSDIESYDPSRYHLVKLNQVKYMIPDHIHEALNSGDGSYHP